MTAGMQRRLLDMNPLPAMRSISVLRCLHFPSRGLWAAYHRGTEICWLLFRSLSVLFGKFGDAFSQTGDIEEGFETAVLVGQASCLSFLDRQAIPRWRDCPTTSDRNMSPDL